MSAAQLHDGAALDVTIIGEGPTVLVPVNTGVIAGEAAEQMRAWVPTRTSGEPSPLAWPTPGFTSWPLTTRANSPPTPSQRP